MCVDVLCDSGFGIEVIVCECCYVVFDVMGECYGVVMLWFV